mgnify:CR=1 FL=1
MFAVPATQYPRAIGVLLGGSGRALPRLDIKPRVAALLRPGPADPQRVGHTMTVCACRS